MMYSLQHMANPTASDPFSALYSQAGQITIVEDETEWRVPRRGSAMASSEARVLPTRWRAATEARREFGAETLADTHVVKIVLRNMNIRLSVAGRTVQDGVAMPGMLHVTEPRARVRCLFRGPYDVLHLRVPNQLIAECAGDMRGPQTTGLCCGKALMKDPLVERLARALLEANQLDSSLGPIYADSISLAIVARLLASGSGAASFERVKAVGLTQWRLKRVIDYVEANLDKPVTLADVASAVGLSRMHFAAQFRAATGMRPHEYLLRRRVERAQQMLVETGQSVVDVALSVGFQTQSHFTTVFKRFAGQPPRAWRHSYAGRAPQTQAEMPGY
jgi:AraC family transcriptional regulator